MHDASEFLRNLALVLGVAAITTVLFRRLRQPVVFGYLLAGFIVGPHLPLPPHADEATIRTLSELGVALLMFSLGTEFSLRRLLHLGWAVPAIAVIETSAMLWLGTVAARTFGWGAVEGVYAGAAVAISSTTIIVRALSEQRVRGGFTDIVFGVLIVEDLIAILMLATLSSTSPLGATHGLPLLALLGRLAAFLAVLVLSGMLIVPRLMRGVVALQRPETTLVVAMGLCFVTAWLAHALGYSVALGAFVAGSLVAESGVQRSVERLIAPVRDMFVAIFFVSVGMLIDPRQIAANAIPVLVLTVLVLLGKTVSVSMATFLTGAGVRTAVQTGMSLAQIGEFSFIIAAAGIAAGASSAKLFPITVAVSALTTLTTPLMIRVAPTVAAAIDRRLPRPLQMFVALYGSWFASMRQRPETSRERARLRRLIQVLCLDAAAIGALAIGTSVGAAPLSHALAAHTPLTAGLARTLVAAGAMLLALPFLLALVTTARALGQTLARRAFPDPAPGRLDPAAAPRRALVATVQMAAVLLLSAPLVAVTQPFLPTLAGPAVLALAAAALGVVVWRNANDLQGHVRAAAEAIVDAIGRHARAGDPGDAERALHRAYQLLPGLGEPQPVHIRRGSAAVGRALAELALRGRTGATILAISRGDDVVLVPDGHETLREGDVVALAGAPAAIEAARTYLQQEAAG